MRHEASLSIIRLRHEWRARRTARRAQADLRRDLAHYNTPAERLELDAILERHTSAETAEIRGLLGR